MRLIHKITGAIVEVAPVIKDGKHCYVDTAGRIYLREELEFQRPGKAIGSAFRGSTAAVKVNVSSNGQMLINTKTPKA